MGELQVLLFLVLMLGVGLGSAAAAWTLRPSKEERAAWDSWVARSTPMTVAKDWRSETVTTAPLEPPQTS